MMESLLRHGFIANERTGEGETALHIACRNGSLEAVKMLVRYGADLHATTRTLGHTPLHYACIGGATDVATFLVRPLHLNSAHLPGWMRRPPGASSGAFQRVPILASSVVYQQARLRLCAAPLCCAGAARRRRPPARRHAGAQDARGQV